MWVIVLIRLLTLRLTHCKWEYIDVRHYNCYFVIILIFTLNKICDSNNSAKVYVHDTLCHDYIGQLVILWRNPSGLHRLVSRVKTLVSALSWITNQLHYWNIFRFPFFGYKSYIKIMTRSSLKIRKIQLEYNRFFNGRFNLILLFYGLLYICNENSAGSVILLMCILILRRTVTAPCVSLADEVIFWTISHACIRRRQAARCSRSEIRFIL